MSQKRSTWSRPPIDERDGGEPESAPPGKLSEARERAAEIGERVKANVLPVAGAVGARVRAGFGKVGDALREDDAGAIAAELFTQADLPELPPHGDALVALGRRLDREADFWRSVAMRQLARAAWMERLGVSGSVALLIGAVVLASIAGFRALFATKSGTWTAVLVGVGIAVLLLAALAVGRIASRLRQGQLEAGRDAMVRADLAEVRLHRVALLMELRNAGKDGFIAALSELEADVRSA